MSERTPWLPAQDDLEATVTFLRQWLREPRSIAAIAPSGRELARRMARAAGDARRVVELGAGTGAITRALLANGVTPDQLLVVERNPDLHDWLERKFPGVEVARADAFDLERVVADSRGLAPGRVDAVVSGLGLLSYSRDEQRRLLTAAFQVLTRRGRFVQFTYAPVFPVARDLLTELDLTSRRVAFSLRNLPPASIYVVTRRRRARR
ncbi:MAG: methyltransferase domain-containing protein [Thermoanaerobaculia bacterium]|nr:MAG: methyltransferase domain-containing protein [Thermoanaerobaculia bacterium]